MTSNLEHFEHFTLHHGTVEVGGNHFLEYEGKGTCLVHPLLPDGTSTTVKLMNVLYVPSLGHNLIAWNVLRTQYICEMGGKDVCVKKKKKKTLC